jgi:hypothetical protein
VSGPTSPAYRELKACLSATMIASERIACLQAYAPTKPTRTLPSTSEAKDSAMSDNPYLVTVGASNVSYRDTEDGATLAADLAKTIGWLEESKAEYQELERKVKSNSGWFVDKDMSHPKYETYADIFNDQKERSSELLLRMRSLCDVGKGEADRLDPKKHKEMRARFHDLEAWVRQIRKEVAEREGCPF